MSKNNFVPVQFLSFLYAVFAFAVSMSPALSADNIPIVTVPTGVTSLDDIGLYGVTYRYTDGRTGSKPIGWSGHFDDETGISVTPFGDQNGKRVFLTHPMWHGGTGDTDQTFRLLLPQAKSIQLSFSVAMQTDVVGKSDGATFRLFINGTKQLDINKADSAWTDEHFDLSQNAGKVVTLTFEIDPGPRNNSSFDYAFWGDRTITCAGGTSQSVSPLLSPLSVSLDSQEAGWGSDSPTHYTEPKTSSLIMSSGVSDPKTLFGGLFFLIGHGKTQRALPFASTASLDLVRPDGSVINTSSPEVVQKVTVETLPSGTTIRRATFTIGSEQITVVASIDRYDGSCVRLSLSSDDPSISAFHFGSIGPIAFQHHIEVPYYGSILYSSDLGAYINVYADYGLSQAARLDQGTAYYDPLTDGTRIPLKETIYYAISANPESVLPTPIGKPSPYRQTMGERAVVDYWGGNASGFAGTLQNLSTYGLTNFLTIIHDWQHGGYDQQLPTVLPANESIGGNAGLLTLSNTTKNLGELLALHENYVDFYPNGPLYNKDDIAVSPDGKLKTAWMFPGHISYLMTPIAMHKYASMITPEVHREIGTTASYLDVHSSIPPYIHTDSRAGRPGAGQFETMVNAQRELWQYMRDVHGGPVLGEGNNHWYWSGMLDGVEAQFGTGVPQNDAESAPLFVDFDLLKIHPRQINHGMGYLERWLAPGETSPPTQKQLDDYRMEEIAYGHSAFVSNWPQTLCLPFIWDEHNVVIPVASRYALAKVRSIQYDVNGKLLDTAAAIAASAKFDRVKIVYNNGLAIWANSRRTAWVVGSNTNPISLPQYGWAAVAPDLTAYTATRDAGTVSFAETPRSLYANARTTLVESSSGTTTDYAVPSLMSCKETAPLQVSIRFKFLVNTRIPGGFVPFIHFVNTDGDIVAQSSSGIQNPPSEWPTGQSIIGNEVPTTLPGTLPDGTYEIRDGLYSPATGERLNLAGVDDGGKRYRLMTLVVSDSGKLMKFQPIVTPPSEYADANHIVDFGTIATNGSIKMTKLSENRWRLIPLPRTQLFVVYFKRTNFFPAINTVTAVPIDENQKSVGQPTVLGIDPVRGMRLTINLPTGGIGYDLTYKTARQR